MRLNYGGETYGLPPAYYEVERYFNLNLKFRTAYLEATRKNQEATPAQEQEAQKKAEKFLTLAQGNKARMVNVFSEVFCKETAAGDFSIIRAEGFFSFVAEDEKAAAYFGTLLQTSPDAFTEVVKALERTPGNVPRFLGPFQQYLTEGQIEILWTTFKEALDTKSASWSSDKQIAGVDLPGGVVFSYNFLDAVRRGARAFLSCVNAPESVLTEAPFLFYPENGDPFTQSRRAPLLDSMSSSAVAAVEKVFASVQLSSSISNDYEDEEEDPFMRNVTRKAPPLIVQRVRPEYFAARVKEESIDPAVVDMLILSWRNDLGSFLISAKQLSGDNFQEV